MRAMIFTYPPPKYFNLTDSGMDNIVRVLCLNNMYSHYFKNLVSQGTTHGCRSISHDLGPYVRRM